MNDFQIPDGLRLHVPFAMPDGTPLTEYWPVRQLPSGEWIGVRDMAYTAGLHIGIDSTGYGKRFCYETRGEAMVALVMWTGEGDPPGRWIKEKPGDRRGPWYDDPYAEAAA